MSAKNERDMSHELVSHKHMHDGRREAYGGATQRGQERVKGQREAQRKVTEEAGRQQSSGKQVAARKAAAATGATGAGRARDESNDMMQ